MTSPLRQLYPGLFVHCALLLALIVSALPVPIVAAEPDPKSAAKKLQLSDELRQRCLDILARHGAAFCIYELAGEAAPREVTADFVYVRLHGPGEAYQGRYRTSELAGWAGAFHSWAGQGREIFCFFDNDQNGYAALNALELRAMIGSD